MDPFAEDSYYVYLSDMVSVSAETILPTFDPRTSFGCVSCHWEPSHQIKPSILKVADKIVYNRKS